MHDALSPSDEHLHLLHFFMKVLPGLHIGFEVDDFSWELVVGFVVVVIVVVVTAGMVLLSEKFSIVS